MKGAIDDPLESLGNARRAESRRLFVLPLVRVLAAVVDGTRQNDD
jgi:hypothetical protein